MPLTRGDYGKSVSINLNSPYLLLRLQQSLKVWVLWVCVVLLMSFLCWRDAAVDVSHFIMVALDWVNGCGQCVNHKGLFAECSVKLSHVQLPVSQGYGMNTSQHALDLFLSIFCRWRYRRRCLCLHPFESVYPSAPWILKYVTAQWLTLCICKQS